MRQTNQNKTKFQTKYTKLTGNNINSSIFDMLRKTETQNEGCCSTDDPHPSRQQSCKRLCFPTLQQSQSDLEHLENTTLGKDKI